MKSILLGLICLFFIGLLVGCSTVRCANTENPQDGVDQIFWMHKSHMDLPYPF